MGKLASTAAAHADGSQLRLRAWGLQQATESLLAACEGQAHTWGRHMLACREHAGWRACSLAEGGEEVQHCHHGPVIAQLLNLCIWQGQKVGQMCEGFGFVTGMQMYSLLIC